MEILTENTLMAEHIFYLVISGIGSMLCAFFTISFICYFTMEGVDGASDIIGFIVMTVLAAFLATSFFVFLVQGPDIQYEAIITDFNEVYENGYEIVDKRGEIYVVEKVESEAN